MDGGNGGGGGDEVPRRADVVVVGAGLAGLTAAVAAATAGATVCVLEAHGGGGRAAVTDVGGGVLFNGGPRGWYDRGPGAAALASLGIGPRRELPGRRAPSRGAAVLRDGGLRGVSTVLGRLPAVLGVVRAAVPATLATVSAAEWVAAAGGAADVLAALVRLSCYADDLEALSAEAAAAQLRVAAGGVRYLDGGFGAVVDALERRAADLGARVVRHAPVRAVAPTGGGVVVDGDAGPVAAGQVVLASGPEVSRRLLGDDGAELVGPTGPPAVAACLELATRVRPSRRFVLGLDEPLYLSEHAPPARLAPPGVRVVHLLRYGTTSATADRERLVALARAAGLDPDGARPHGLDPDGARPDGTDTDGTAPDVTAARFLRRMVVTSAVPTPELGGLAGRPPVSAPHRPRVHLAGDWVGPVGLLADAALASGAAAGRAAAP